MNDEVEQLVKDTLTSINGYILQWFGMYSMGPLYKILDQVWEFTGIRTNLESSINSIISKRVQLTFDKYVSKERIDNE